MNDQLKAPSLFDEIIASSSEVYEGPPPIDSDVSRLSESKSNIEPNIPIQQTAELAAESKQLLPSEARTALVMLLRHGVIMGDQRPEIYAALMKYKEAITSHLANMYLRIITDERNSVVILLEEFTSDADDHDIERPSVLRADNLNVYETILVLVLRKYYQDREAAGDRKITIDIEYLESLMLPFLKESNNSALDQRKLSGAIKKAKTSLILRNVRDSDSLFEITAVIRYVVNANFLQHMLAEYQKLVDERCVDEQGATE